MMTLIASEYATPYKADNFYLWYLRAFSVLAFSLRKRGCWLAQELVRTYSYGIPLRSRAGGTNHMA